MIATGRKNHGEPSTRIAISSTTTTVPANAISRIHGSFGSFLRVSVYACRIMPSWLPNRLSRPGFFSPAAFLSALRPDAALEPRPRPPAAGPRPALPLGAGVSVGLLRAMPRGYGRGLGVPRIRPGSSPSRHPARLDRLLVEPPRAVGAAHERTGQHPGEADPLGLLAEADELLRLDPADDGVVARRGPQVLGDREQVAAGLVQRLHRLDDLVRLLAHAQDQVGLGDQAGLARRGEHRQGALEPETRADPAEDPRHGLDVVRQHLGPGGEDLGELVGLRVEVGDEQLDTAARDGGLDLAHRLRVEPRTAVGQVVAGDAGDRGVAQPHGRDALGDPARLVGVEVGRLAGVDLAEGAAPGALVAADEEGRLAVLPALVDVGAAGLLADRVQPLAADQRLQLGVLRAGLEPGLDPLRLALDRHLAVADLETQELAAARPDRRTRISGGYGRLRHDPHGTSDATRPPAPRRRSRGRAAPLPR